MIHVPSKLVDHLLVNGKFETGFLNPGRTVTDPLTVSTLPNISSQPSGPSPTSTKQTAERIVQSPTNDLSCEKYRRVNLQSISQKLTSDALSGYSTVKATRNMLRIFVIIIIANAAMAQVPFLGTCPNLEAMQNFELDRYLGKWYEVERYFSWFEFGGKCVTANYSMSENDSVKIVNKQISSLTGVATSIEGIGRLIGRSDDPKLSVTFPSLPLPFDAPYWVLDSDYKSYAVVWSCTNLGVLNVRNVWILTREPKPPVAVVEKAYQVIDRSNISRAYFIRTDQKNCPASN